ncbi:MAG: glucosidase [Chloroflexota bacterium]|nr:glucosidase [Chloroflexota bacterium]
MNSQKKQTAEHQRLADSEARQADWKHWGPYVSDRAWGTVREDYSPGGRVWQYFPHDHARSRAYRWNEDGLGGFSNRFQNLVLAVALWNEHDPILKERLFGVTGNEGNHGEDVKEYYFYLDGTPTHTYQKMLYKYPQVEYPYGRLVEENRRRGKHEPEFELIDALREVFEQGRYFDIFIEYAKAGQEDILCRITAVNRGPHPAPIHILPHLWFRNTWTWRQGKPRPELRAVAQNAAQVEAPHLGPRWWYARRGDPFAQHPAASTERAAGTEAPLLLFTENETNAERLFGHASATAYVKDGINDAVVHGHLDRVNPEQRGSKVAAHFQAVVPPGETFMVHVRFTDTPAEVPFADFDAIFARRIAEADEFYAVIASPGLSEDERLVQRQALAGITWSKQFYHYSVERWMDGDPGQAQPPAGRLDGRNTGWRHLYALDVLSMPDKWEYPWFAAWDLAFHAVPIAMIDSEWAKRQLLLLLREWYMHPNGQIPGYEWNFSDVNPPVHAWAALQVYRIDREQRGEGDADFLERVFHKLLLNFTWWVNRVDADDRNVFQGGFLGLDNIGLFDRSAPLPTGGHIEQTDGTAWMAMFSLNMLAISLELARTRPAYEDVATKFFEHFIYIADAFYNLGDADVSLWDEEDGFFYNVLHMPDGRFTQVKVRSFVGLLPLLAVETLEPEILERLPRFRRRLEWFLRYRPGLIANVASLTEKGVHDHYQLAILDRDKLARILDRVFDSGEFLSDYGLRSLSREYAEHPYELRVNGQSYRVDYQPAESDSGLFGGNSNWRGPIWFPLNYLMVEALRRHGHHYGDTLMVELPTGSGQQVTLNEAADELCRRLARLFLRDESTSGRRPVFGDEALFQADPNWRDHVLFYEYFHGDSGAGVGASHQTGWTALVAKLMQDIST